MPFKATVRFLYDVRIRQCIYLYLTTGGNDYKLGSSCDGVLPPLPPTTPKPPEPLSCSVTWQSSGEIDFGVMTPGENKAKGIAAKLACQGGTSGKRASDLPMSIRWGQIPSRCVRVVQMMK